MSFFRLEDVSRIAQIEKLPRKRAVLEKDKLTKRTSIIQSAAALLLKKDLDDLSMDEVAKRAKVAKGTLYLYFPTKEDLALRVHMSDYQLWFEDLRQYLTSEDSKEIRFEDWFVGTFEKHNRFMKLLPIVPTILEKNASYETIREFKSEVMHQLQSVLPPLTEKLGFKGSEDTFTFMMQCYAIAIGSWSHGFPSPTVKQVLNEKELQGFLIDYTNFVKTSIQIMLKGYKER